MSNLHLPLTRKWFDLTKFGGKTEDYREITPYWFKRLVYNYKEVLRAFDLSLNDLSGFKKFFEENENAKKLTFKWFDYNEMTLGYPAKNDANRRIVFEHLGIDVRTGKPEWGAVEGRLYFVILHGKFIKNGK